MLTSKEKIDQFKRELKSMSFYSKRANELYDNMLRLGRCMQEEGSESNDLKTTSPMNYLILLEEEEQCISEYDLMMRCKRSIEQKLEKCNAEDRSLLIDIYVKGYSFDKVSMQKYMSVRNVKYKVDSIIKSIV